MLLAYWSYTHTPVGAGSPSNHAKGCKGETAGWVWHAGEAQLRDVPASVHILALFGSRLSHPCNYTSHNTKLQ